jgi:hypothetical protein
MARRRRPARALRDLAGSAGEPPPGTPAGAAYQAPAARAPAPPRRPRQPVPERYGLAEAGALLGVSAGALRRRAEAGAIALERDGSGGVFVTRAELARHAASYTPRPGGRPPAVPDEVVARIADLRAEGLSYARIAALLTLEGVPTAHGGRRWWASSVRAVLGRAQGAPPARPQGSPR